MARWYRPLVPVAIAVPLLLAGCGEQPSSSNPAVTPLAPVSRTNCEAAGGLPSAGADLPSTTIGNAPDCRNQG